MGALHKKFFDRLNADDTIVQLRRPPDAPEALRSIVRSSTSPAQPEIDSAVNMVARAAAALESLARRNKEIEETTSRTVAQLKSEARTAQAEADQLLNHVKALEKENESEATNARERISNLEAEIDFLRRELDSVTRSYNKSNQLLVNFTSEVENLLGFWERSS